MHACIRYLGWLRLLYVDDDVRLFSSSVNYMQMTWHCTLRYKPDSDLQSSCLNAIVACSDQWQLSVSSKISTVLYLGQTSINQSYKIKHASISPVSVIRDLGIITDNKLTMSHHICTVVNKARTRASLIYKCFHSRHRSTLLKAIITYVYPLLEYATPVWSPHTLSQT